MPRLNPAFPLGVLLAFVTAGIVRAADPISLRVARDWPLAIDTHHVQGLAVSDDFYWVSSVDKQARQGWLYRIDRKTLQVVEQRQLADGARFHPGGIQLVGQTLWLPLAEYRANSTSLVLRLNALTLATEKEFAIDDHLGAIAADGRGTLYAANWDSRQIRVLNEEGQIRETVDSPTGVAYQDFEWHDGLLWATGRLKQEGVSRPVVDCIEPGVWQLKSRYLLEGQLRSGGNNFAREGFSKLGDTLFLLPEDGPQSTIYSFTLPRR